MELPLNSFELHFPCIYAAIKSSMEFNGSCILNSIETHPESMQTQSCESQVFVKLIGFVFCACNCFRGIQLVK